jgi:flagellar biosynthetic protein FlhB
VAEESDDDKTEAPTPHRLEKAREEGQIPDPKS